MAWARSRRARAISTSSSGKSTLMTFPLCERHGGLAAERVDDGQAAMLQAVAAALLEDDVLGLVLLGDPHRAFHGADGAAGAVGDLEGLVRPQLHCAPA